MARQTFDDDEEEPLDPAVEKIRRKLVRFVAINLGLLFLALMAVVGALVYKALSVPPRAPSETGPVTEVSSPEIVAEGQIELPAGARIISQSLSGNHISLLLELPGGGRAIHFYDASQGRIVGRFAISAE